MHSAIVFSAQVMAHSINEPNSKVNFAIGARSNLLTINRNSWDGIDTH